jgi:Ca2+-binding RTX toxin-like protein
LSEVDTQGGLTSARRYDTASGKIIAHDILIPGNPIGVDFSQAGGIIGQQLGYRLAGGNRLTGVVYSAGLQTLGDNLGDVLDGLVFTSDGKANDVKEVVDEAFAATGKEFLTNLQSAGVGAVSSYLTAELVNAIGLGGFAGELANSAIETLKLNDGLAVSLSSILIAASGTQLVGTTGDDLMIGQTGVLADSLSGGDGNDVLVGYAGNDPLTGGNGNGVFEGGLGADTLDGGANSLSSAGPDAGDTARYVRSAAGVSVNLTLSTAQGGTAGSDSIGDILLGGAGDDDLDAEAGDDYLDGGLGNDLCRRGGGARRSQLWTEMVHPTGFEPVAPRLGI